MKGSVNLAGYSIVIHSMQNIRYSVDTLVRGNLSPSHVTGDATGRADMCVRVGGDGTGRQFDFDSFCSFLRPIVLLSFVGDLTVAKV